MNWMLAKACVVIAMQRWEQRADGMDAPEIGREPVDQRSALARTTR